ncbi:sporulation protein [uncultured Metabacillus sp.]|uniref:sporulation protein n=1 Tax=uncultured Metabacillus sp. TaxID=2860135 RepID=UPI002625580D|nr:sporulation protein [uncultured Metabacillus sp.]
MSLFNKILASVGIGSAKVDTKLAQSSIKAGEEVDGIVEIKGGNIEQKVDEVYLTINTTYEKEDDDKVVHKQAVISTIKLNEPFVIMPGETKTIPFKLEVPLDTPISAGASKVWVQTGVDIKGSVDPSDRDMLEILPHDMMDEALKVFSELGFTLRKVKNEEASYKIRKRLPFIQEFEFIPNSGQYYEKFDEVELIFFPLNEEKLEIIIEVDRRSKGLAGLFSEALDMDESIIRFSLNKHEMPTLKATFIDILKKHG